MRGPLLALALILLLPAAAAAEGIAASYAIEAKVSDDLREIRGSLKADLRNDTGAPLETLVLWLYPNLFEGDLPGITDVNRALYAPWSDSGGGIALEHVLLNGAPLELAHDVGPSYTIRLPVPVEPEASLRVTLDFVTRVPHRLGPFGFAHGVLTSLGGWHPYFTELATDPLDLRPPPADWSVRLEIPAHHVALVGGERADRAVALEAREWADLVVRPTRLPPIAARGGNVWPLDRQPRDDWDLTSRPDPAPFESAAVGDELAKLLAQMDRWADAQPGVPDPGPLQLVVVPMRSEIALSTPGIVAVSDRAFQVTPLRIIQNQHARGIARAYFARRFLALARRCESPAIAPQIADGLGAIYAERFTNEVLGGARDAAGLLGPFDFVPSVDDFLRSPKSAFPQVYFQPVSDPIPVRDEPWTFNNLSPRGKLLFEKLRDWLGDEKFYGLVAAYVAGEACPLQPAAEDLAGSGLGVFFGAWTSARPEEDLHVRIVSSAELPDGSWSSVVEVRRVGDTPPEVIETAAWESDGDRHTLVWRAEPGDASEEFMVHADQPITRLQVDPRGRVSQTPSDPGEISAVGDRVPARIQLLLTRFGVSYSLADDSFFGDIDFLLRPRDAVRRRLGLGASYRQARVEVRTAITFGFGPLVDAARYSWNWGLGLSADYLRAGFGGDATAEGFAVGPAFGLSYDDRPAATSPLRGTAFSTGVSMAAGANRGGDSSIYGGFSAGVLRLFPLGPRSTFAMRAKGNVLFGNPPIQELVPLGGSDEGLRGFPLESVLSRQRAIVSAEYRHPLFPDFDIDFGLARLRQVSGAIFADGAFAGDLYPLFPGVPDEAFFADVGYGLRFEYDLLGVRPLTFAVDAAVPFNRAAAANTLPVVFSVRAGQAFSGP